MAYLLTVPGTRFELHTGARGLDLMEVVRRQPRELQPARENLTTVEAIGVLREMGVEPDEWLTTEALAALKIAVPAR